MQSLRDELEEKRAGILDEMESRATVRSRHRQSPDTADHRKVPAVMRSGKELSLVSGEQTQADDAIVALKEEFRQVGVEIRAFQDGQKDIEAQIAAHKTSLGDADALLQRAQFSWHQEKSKLDAIMNLAERYEGFGGSVKRVMQERSREQGIIGTVADLISTEKKYETAIEVALGGSIQNIVTKDEDTARRMIEILKREKAGRATFLPLSGIPECRGPGRSQKSSCRRKVSSERPILW